MKNFIIKHTDNLFTFIFLICGVLFSASILLSSCAPVSQSISKSKPTEEPQSVPNSPFSNTSKNKNDSSDHIKLDSSFYPLLLSEDDAHNMPLSSVTLDIAKIDKLSREGKVEINSDLIEKAEKIYIVFVLKLNQKNTANIEQNHFVPLLNRHTENTYELVLENHLNKEKNSVILERERVENKIKDKINQVYFYTDQDLAEDEIIKIAQLKDKTSLSKRKQSLTQVVQ